MKSKSVSILLIEDNSGDARLIRELLSETKEISFDTEVCQRLSQGLKALASKGFDVVLLDPGLPDSSGLKSLLRIRTAVPHMAIIVLTGLDDDEFAVRAVRKGAQDYLVKGEISADLLSRAIRYAIERQKADEENRNLEARLRQAQKMEAIGTLAGGIAHDFNNILFSIFGYAEMMLEDVPEDSKLQEPLSIILKASRRAKDLVAQILAFSHQSEQKLSPMKVQAILKEVLKLSRSTLPSTIKICQDIDKKCGRIMADPVQIHQMIMNLVTNAYHAMEETGGCLNVELTEARPETDAISEPKMNPGKYVRLTIADTGSGMEKSVADRIFDPYFTTKRKGKGTGLGLAVVHGIVRSCGGCVSVHSEPGKGTAFHVYLPVPESFAGEDDGKIATKTRIGGGEHILLVDDEVQIAEMEKLIMERLGYQVTALSHSTEALEVFRADPDRFDLVITDMTMPEITGVMLSTKLLEIKPDLPIIICTGYSQQISEKKAKALGIRGYVLKPVIMSELAHIIRKALGER